MSNVRALLKAKRQEIRVNHPLASYNANGQLRCIACGIAIKEGTSWTGHVGSKAHRTNAARLREEERLREQQEEEELLRQKRAVTDVDSDDEDVEIEAKRRRTGEPGDLQHETPAAPAVSTGFPADFFSDASRAPPPPSSEDGSDDEAVPSSAAPPSSTTIDQEWKQFEATVLNAPDKQDTYERATVFAEPVLALETPEGFPSQEAQVAETNERNDAIQEGDKRRQKEQEERELIMDRLLEEEIAQEEADAKVSLLKSRLDALKRQRQATRAAKAKANPK